MKPTRKWWKRAELYEHYAPKDCNLDFSPEAAEKMFRYESTGGELPSERNGYAVGKRWMDWHLTSYLEDVPRYFSKFELLTAEDIPSEMKELLREAWS